jgi:hypothetical protein
LTFLKETWPVLKRHLEWETRNFDSDSDGLYDAYAAIWASDALQYSGTVLSYFFPVSTAHVVLDADRHLV